MSSQTKSVLASVRPEYVPLEDYVAEPLAWCPPTSQIEDSTVYVIVRSGNDAPKILKLANGKVSKVSIKKLPFTSTLAPKPKSILDYLKPQKVITALGYSTIALVLAFVLAVSSNLMSARVVLTGSMSGTFEAGDVVVSANWLKPNVNDIAIYQARDFDGAVKAEFVHRVISGSTATQYEFKGDNNPEKDVLPVTPNDVIGVVLFWVPSIGALLNPKNVLAILSIGLFLYFAIGYLRDELFERRHFKRNKGS